MSVAAAMPLVPGQKPLIRSAAEHAYTASSEKHHLSPAIRLAASCSQFFPARLKALFRMTRRHESTCLLALPIASGLPIIWSDGKLCIGWTWR
eukprot:5065261-Pleurochrysis_carterae.AAC.1